MCIFVVGFVRGLVAIACGLMCGGMVSGLAVRDWSFSYGTGEFGFW